MLGGILCSVLRLINEDHMALNAASLEAWFVGATCGHAIGGGGVVAAIGGARMAHSDRQLEQC